MKIAIPTNDKETVFPRTGQAHGYMIYHVENNSIKGKFYKALPLNLRHKHDHQDESKGHSHRDLCQFLEECDLLLVKNIGNICNKILRNTWYFMKKQKKHLLKVQFKNI